MDTDALSRLNADFQISDAVQFHALPNGFCVAHLRNQHGVASVALQGAHVLNWQPADQSVPVLWMSPQARLEEGKSVRGGIPVCWPWFGQYAGNTAFPAHGFARTASWEVVASDHEEDGGAVHLGLRLRPGQGKSFWPYDTRLELSVRLGKTLALELTTTNFSPKPVLIGSALHTYFKVSDIANIAVTGLEGVEYWDTVGEVAKHVQQGHVRFTKETDRVYINSPVDVAIEDPDLQRRILIKKSGSLSTVVWNPWVEKAVRMGDLGQPDGWRGFVCVETANAWDNRISVDPTDSHVMTVEYDVSRL